MSAASAAKLPADAKDAFRENGFYIWRNCLDKERVLAAARWLKEQNHEKLAKSWTEKEPAVPLAVYTWVHKEDTPIGALARDEGMLAGAAQLIGEEVYIWASKVNIKAAWCGTVEYYHQDLVYWKDRGYPKDEMMACMVFLDRHNADNAGLQVIPGTHKQGFIEHQPFININGLGKFMVPPNTLNALQEKHGRKQIEAEPGDVLFFHTSLLHGSSHNLSPNSRMILLSQLNTVGNEPNEVKSSVKQFNLSRAKREMEEAERRYTWFKKKYEDQLNSDDPAFCAPIPDDEKDEPSH
jgi:ectoine hydroxylase